ncbi:MAG TPA: hypothetical protein VFB44_02115 [Thermoleophilaceae bacterium]|nr:hypothetical protein [Thermoleophilaceae bacterium]
MIERLTGGIWRWTSPHPEWRPKNEWVRDCACFALAADADLVLVDPQAPPDDPDPLFAELDALVERDAPERLAVLTTIHYHVRSAAAVARRYGSRLPVSVHGHASVGGQLGDDVPFEPIEPGAELPGGAVAQAIGKPRRREMPLWFPSERALAFGDAVVGVEDRLRVWDTLGDKSPDWYRERFVPTLEPLVELDPEHVLVTHGPPAIGDGRERLAEALAEPPWWHT